MFIHSIASAFPKHKISQQKLWEFSKQHPVVAELSEKSFGLTEKILCGDSGIDTRHFAVENPCELFDLDAGQLNALFEKEAPEMTQTALERALAKAELTATDIDAVIICTCTGYICPGITSYVAEAMGMREDCYLQDIVGLGCGAAVPTIRSAHGFLAANPDATVAVVAVESCSSAFFIDNDFGVLISLCLFGDGASASIWKSQPGESGYRAHTFDTLHIPKDREKIRFVNDGGKLRNKLHITVPHLAGKAVERLYKKRTVDNPHFICHTGGRDVLETIEKRLEIDPIEESREVLAEYGNVSSPSVLIALEKFLDKAPGNDNLWLTAFGAGFACHSFEMSR